jgi:hypothetical protein
MAVMVMAVMMVMSVVVMPAADRKTESIGRTGGRHRKDGAGC